MAVFFIFMLCHFYILYSKRLDTFYLGHTCDQVENRLAKHNSNHKGFTGRTNDWEIVYKEAFEHKSEAYKREREVKNYKSREIITKIVFG